MAINTWQLREKINAWKDGSSEEPINDEGWQEIRELLWDYDEKVRVIDAYRTVLRHEAK